MGSVADGGGAVAAVRTRPGPRVRRAWRRAVLAVVGSLAAGPAALAAQSVRLAEAPRDDAERAIQRFLDRGDYQVWARDTVLARDVVVDSHVLVLEATARISGRIEGDVLVVDGDLFLRTRGRVAGDVVVLGGGFYDSDLAEIGGGVTYRPNLLIRVRPTAGDYEIFSVEAERDAFELDGTLGFHIPTYQRVDALTLGWGAIARFDGVAGRPDLEGSVRFLTGPGAFEGSLRNSWYPSSRLRLGVHGSRETRSMDRWIRSTWYNSLATLVADDDAFDYYRGTRAGVESEWRSKPPPIWEDAPTWSVTFGAFWERAKSLEARDTWAIFESPAPEGMPAARHPNPAVDDGDYYSIVGSFEWMKRERAGRTAFGIGLEYGIDGRENESAYVPPPSSGATTRRASLASAARTVGEPEYFLMAEGRLSTRRVLPWGHAFDAFAISRVRIGGHVPRQRYSTLGGPGTIATLPLRSMRGPELLYADAGYAVPILGMATLGGLDAFVRGSAGSAWGDGAEFDLLGTGSAGIAVRIWEFQMETGVAVGSGGDDGSRTVWFFDVRTRRSARPSQMPRPGRGF